MSVPARAAVPRALSPSSAPRPVPKGRRSLRALVGVVSAACLAVGLGAVTPASASAAAGGSGDPVVVAVGDIACDPLQPGFNGGLGTMAGCRHRAVADAVRAANPDAFIPLGDIQYYDGRYDAFMASYDPAFGDLKPITYPVPGNHEYKTPGAAGYYQYFGERAHQATKGVYSFDIGSWHFLSLSSIICTARTPCGPGSDVAKWIAWDISTHPASCVAASWHHPLYSAGNNGKYLPMLPVWNQLNSYGVDLVLTGHDHQYQRFAPLGPASLNADGTLAPPTVAADGNGMVEMVLGMGGEDNFGLSTSADAATVGALAASATNPNPAVFGATKLTLHQGSYDFEFLPAAGTTYSDSGTTGCRTKTPPTGLPPTPTAVTATRGGDGTAVVSWNGTTPAGQADTLFTVSAAPGTKTCKVVNTTSCTITGLTNGTPYTFTVNADNAVARTVSQPSDPFVPATRPTRPGTPSVTLGELSATLTWTPPTFGGGLPVTGYTATASPGGRSCTTTGELTCTIAGLTSGVSYSYSVVARNDAAQSAASIGTSGMRAVAAPAPLVTGLTRAGDGGVYVTAAETSTWGTSATGFVITSSPGARKCTITLPEPGCTVTGLTNGAEYTFTAVAVNPLGTSSASVPSGVIVPATRPTRPGTPTVVMGDLTADVTWTAPTYDGGLPVTAYTAVASPGGSSCTTTGDLGCTIEGLTSGVAYSVAVTASNEAATSVASIGSAPVRAVSAPAPAVTGLARAGDGAVTVTAAETSVWSNAATGFVVTSTPGGRKCVIAVPDTSCTVTGLTNGTSYQFTAITLNDVGTSGPSALSDPIVPAVVPTRPGTPAVTLGPVSATLTWTAPAYDGGSPVTGYTATASPGGLTCATTGALGCTITGLTSGVSYSFAVTAANEVGTSVSGVGSTPVKAVSAPAPVVTGLARAGDGAVSVTAAEVATWGIPTTGFTMISTPGSKRCTATLPATSCVVTGLTNGVAYQFAATTNNALGTSAPSALSAALVAGKVPGRPTNVVGTATGGGTALVTWLAPSTDGGLPITRYSVVAAPGGRPCTTSGALSCTVTGLTPGTSYSFSVVATNEAGSSPSSIGSVGIKVT